MPKPICNVHVHVFNAQYVPDKFIGQFIGAFPKTITSILKSKWASRRLLKFLGRFNERSKLGKFVAFLKVGIKESQYQVFHGLANNEGYPAGTRFVVLPLNFQYMGAGKVTVPYEQQLNKLIEAKVSAPDTLLPFVFIDPRMGDAEYNLNFVKRYIEEKGFVGIKLYPSLGYYPYDPKLEQMYAYAEKNAIPIMTHCSSTGVFYNDAKNIPEAFLHPQSFNPQTTDELNGGERAYNFKMPVKGWRKKKNLALFADNFLNPVNYTDVLQEYPKLKICFAHFGLDNEQHEGNITLNWHENILELMKRYENVYTDISYSLHYEDVREQFKTYLDDAIIKDKILFGTDFFMTLQEEIESEQELLLKTMDSFGNHFEKIAGPNIENYLNSNFYKY